METPAAAIETLVQQVEQYGLSTVELYKLKTIDKTADLVSETAVITTLFVFLLLFISILSVGAAILIGRAIGELYLGFFIVAGFYGILTGVLYIFRDKWIRKPVKNAFIRKVEK